MVSVCEEDEAAVPDFCPEGTVWDGAGKPFLHVVVSRLSGAVWFHSGVAAGTGCWSSFLRRKRAQDCMEIPCGVCRAGMRGGDDATWVRGAHHSGRYGAGRETGDGRCRL